MANAVKKMRLPPASNEDLTQRWIEAGQGTGASGHQVTRSPSHQVTGDLSAQERPEGPGIVQRADGAYLRRLVVYVEPSRARQLKAAAALGGRDMSKIVDGLIEDWLATQ